MSNTQNMEEIQVLMRDILIGLKSKLIKPILNENELLAQKIEELREKDSAQFEELRDKVKLLEQKIEQNPRTILEAIRIAIEQTGEC